MASSTAGPSNSGQTSYECHICHESFDSFKALNEHLKKGKKDRQHTEACKRCINGFANERALVDHLKAAKEHRNPAVQRLEELRRRPVYQGVPKGDISHVVKTTRRLYASREDPDASMIIRKSGTYLSAEIVETLRLDTLREINKNKSGKKAKDPSKLPASDQDEENFTDRLIEEGLQFETEKVQRAHGRGKPTPDVLFIRPTRVCGFLCNWIEYKSFLGYNDNPYVTHKNSVQFATYVDHYGPGMVVYKLGFEAGWLQNTVVKIMREQDVLDGLEMTRLEKAAKRVTSPPSEGAVKPIVSEEGRWQQELAVFRRAAKMEDLSIDQLAKQYEDIDI